MGTPFELRTGGQSGNGVLPFVWQIDRGGRPFLPLLRQVAGGPGRGLNGRRLLDGADQPSGRLRSRTPASPDFPAASPAGRVHPRGDDRGLFDGADRLRGWLLHQLQLARNQFPPRLDRALAVPHPSRIDVEPHPGARRGITVVIGRRIVVLVGRRNSLPRGTTPDWGHRPGRGGQRRVVATHEHQAARRPPVRRGRPGRDTAPVRSPYMVALRCRLLPERRTGSSSEFTSIYESCVEVALVGPYTREDFRRSEISCRARRTQDREADTSWSLLWQPSSSVIPGATRISPSTSRSTPSVWRPRSSRPIPGR